MRRLLFHSLLLLSLKEKKARRIPFHPQVTIIKGINDTGKSCLIKSIYRTLGAELPQIPPKWEDANAISLLIFSIDSIKYKMLRNGSLFCLFHENNSLIQRFSSVTSELGPYFSELFNFKLPLKTRSAVNQATPAFLFLPFYFDQDRSWQKQWESFTRLQQFASWKDDVINFHSGIRPTEYFEAKIIRDEEEREKNELITKQKVLADTIIDIEKKLNLAQFSVNIETYREEINALLMQCEIIKKDEDILKKQLLEQHNKKIILMKQKEIIEHEQKELNKDYEHALDLDDMIDCPICGQVYENTFNERFAVAQDEHRCHELLQEVNSSLHEVMGKIKKINEQVTELKQQHSGINQLLETKHGEIKLKDVIKSEGRKEVDKILRGEYNSLKTLIDGHDKSIANQTGTMTQFDNKPRRKEVKTKYLALMQSFLIKLNVMQIPENNYKKMNCTIKETGSDLPRALLAYYFALLHLINEFSSSTYCPIVLDSPKQQDQDDDNWEKMLNFIKTERPANSQLILGLVDDLDVDFQGDVINLNNKYSLLLKEDFESVYSELESLISTARL